MNSKDIVQDRLAAITQEQQKLRGMQDQAVAARDQALAQLAQYRDLELRLNGAATVLQEVLGAISIQEANQAAQEQAAKDQAALVAVQDKVLEIVRGIKKSKNKPAGMSSRLDLDASGMLELALRLEDAFGIDVDAGEDDDDHDDDGQDGDDLKKVTDAETINDVVGSPDVANAQLLSRKPSSEGLIYPRIDADVHALTAEELLWLIAERRVEGATPQQLADIVIGELGGEWVGGIDFGYTHNFSVSELLVVKPWAIVFDFFESAGLELEQQIALCEERGVLARNPRIYPDMAYPGSIAAFSRRKFKMIRWKKGPGSVADGIQITRGKLRPTMGQPELLFLRQSPGAMRLMELLSKYHFTKDAQGNWTDVPSEDGDDGPDSLRYAVQNTFPSQASGVIVASASPPVAVGAHGSDDIQQQWFSQMMQHVGGSYDQLRLDQGVRMVKKGRAVILS